MKTIIKKNQVIHSRLTSLEYAKLKILIARKKYAGVSEFTRIAVKEKITRELKKVKK